MITKHEEQAVVGLSISNVLFTLPFAISLNYRDKFK